MSQKNIKNTFGNLIKILDLTEGKVYADLGASNGAYDVMMASLTKGVTYYVQDIDTTCLNQREFKKVVDYYTQQSGYPITTHNRFHLTMGDVHQTNLPDNTFDVIYSNGAFHVFSDKLAIMRDVYRKLKPGGYLFIRDRLAKGPKKELCNDEKCRHPLLQEQEFLSILQNSRFVLIKKYPRFEGTPIFKFQKPE